MIVAGSVGWHQPATEFARKLKMQIKSMFVGLRSDRYFF